MKLLLIFCILLMSAHLTSAQSCCTPVAGATASFASFTKSKSFRAAHAEPKPFQLTHQSGSMISFSCTDKQDGHAYFVAAAHKSNKYVFMIHEWWGLNDYIKKEAENLQSELGPDVNVVALDLYDGKVATTRESAAKYMSEANETRVRTIINGAIQHVGATAHVATIGWCFGGGWSMQSSLMLGSQAAGCVIYYGMPESDDKKLEKLSAPVMVILANKDKWITPEIVHAFEDRMKRMSKSVVVHAYDADHAFANPSNPIFDTKAAADAHAHCVEFLKERLK